MTLLVRKIDKAKWCQNDIKNGGSPSADAITGCLRTSQNALSVWRIDNENQLDNAILAMAATFQHIDTIDVALIEENELTEQDIAITQRVGRTPYKDMEQNHRDIAGLDYDRLGTVAEVIVSCFKKERLRRFTRTSLRKILAKGVADGQINIADLSDRVRDRLAT